eukprot:9962987-Heterocapsa_arctica.AAC.1
MGTSGIYAKLVERQMRRDASVIDEKYRERGGSSGKARLYGERAGGSGKAEGEGGERRDGNRRA